MTRTEELKKGDFKCPKCGQYHDRWDSVLDDNHLSNSYMSWLCPDCDTPMTEV